MLSTTKHPAWISRCIGDAIAASGPSKNAAGQPVQTFRKELIRKGQWQHPATGQKFTIDDRWLDNAAAQFGKMKASGAKVPVPSGHSFSADDSRGWVSDIFRQGDSLYGMMEMVGDDGIAAAGRNDVSIYAEPEYKDAHGTVYPWAIQHVALTPVPVIPGMSGFVALSRDGIKSEVPIFELSTETTQMNPNLTKLVAGLGLTLAADISEDAAWVAVLAATEKNKTDAATIKASADAEKKRADEATLALSNTKPPAYDAPTLAMFRENRELKLANVYKAGKITKDFHDTLASVFIGGAGSLALSATLDTANDQRFRQILDGLDKMTPIRELDAHQTAAQGFALANDRAKPPSDAPDPDMKERLARAGIKTA